MTTTDTARNANLEDLVALLRDQHARKVDIVAPASQIRSRDGVLIVKGTDAILTDDGVTTADGRYRPTEVADEGLAGKLGIGLTYVRRMRTEAPDLLDANVNGWLAGRTVVRGGERQIMRAADPRSFLIRAFRGQDGGEGVARAFLSDKYSVMDNLDVLTAALDGISRAGVAVDVVGADLSDRRMYVRVQAPQVQALAPRLLQGYRSPFTSQRGEDLPVVFAGFEITNSEVGCGAVKITPRAVVQVCTNGLTVTRDAMRAVHLGGKMDEGVIQWSQDTQDKQLALITAKTRDAVSTFLTGPYLEGVLAGLEETAAVEVHADAVQVVAKRLSFDAATTDGVLSHFVRGGQITAGGVMQAITSYAQTVANPDRANELEAVAIQAMDLAAARRI